MSDPGAIEVGPERAAGADAGSGDRDDRFARAVPVADAVLWEGYVLYPYRASAAKNRLRFNWGIVGPAEEPTMASTVLVERHPGTIDVRIRFLHLIARSDGWDEAEPAMVDVSVDLDEALHEPRQQPFTVSGGGRTGRGPHDGDGRARTAMALDGMLTASATAVDDGAATLTVTVENLTTCPSHDRDERLRASFVGCHLLLAGGDGRFLSVLDPPDHLSGVASGLFQHRAWPVLIGPEPARDLVLASPVILYDYPSVAPESVGDFYDATEIDEMLALRVHTLTEEEKAEARALDPRTRAIIDRHDHLEPGIMAELHGTVREPGTSEPDPVDPNPEWSDPGPNTALVGGVWIEPGSKVRLHPSKRADVHDMFLKGRLATVAQIVHDVDGEIHVAVTVDDDPGADLYQAQRRFLYFAPDELAAVKDATMGERILVAGVGNIFCSDDGFGSAVADALLNRPLPTEVRVVDYGIRGVHLAFDLGESVESLILVDTVPEAAGEPGSLAVIEVDPDAFGTSTFDAHAMDPGAVFRSLAALGDDLPRTLVVGCQPGSLDDGIGLTPAVAAAVPVAADKVMELVENLLVQGPGNVLDDNEMI